MKNKAEMSSTSESEAFVQLQDSIKTHNASGAPLNSIYVITDQRSSSLSGKESAKKERSSEIYSDRTSNLMGSPHSSSSSTNKNDSENKNPFGLPTNEDIQDEN